MTDWKPGIDKNKVPYLELDITEHFTDIFDIYDPDYPDHFRANIRKYPRSYCIAYTYWEDISDLQSSYHGDHDYGTPFIPIEIWHLWRKIPHVEFNFEKTIKEFHDYLHKVKYDF